MIETMTFSLAIRDQSMPERSEAGAVALMGEEEFRSFYERTARPLWAYLSRIARDSQQADDFLQEAYYRLYRAGARYENESHRRNSLFQIATNLVRDAARRARHHQDVPLMEEDDESFGAIPISDSPVPEHQATIRTDLARAMGKLEPVQREMLWLAYAQGASHEEIGEILGLKPVSIRTLLLRARRKLAAILTTNPQEARR